jgi:plastocyanin
MASNTAPVVDRIRIIPRPDDFLNRNVGSSGEVFYDKGSDTLRLYNGKDPGGIGIAKSDLTNISDSTLTARLTALGYTTGDAGGTDPVDTGGNANITVSGTAPTDAAEGELWLDTVTGVLFVYYNEWIQPSYNYVVDETIGNSFNQIAVSGQTTVEAIGQETLTLAAGNNILLTTDAETNTITITSTASGGGSSFDQSLNTTDNVTFNTLSFSSGVTINEFSADGTLSGASSTAVPTESAVKAYVDANAGGAFSNLTDVSTTGINVSKIYEPCSVMLRVDNIGTSAYTFNTHYTGNNPTLYFISGTTVAFDLTLATGHPFELQDNSLTALASNIVHVANDGTISTGTNAQGKDSGVLYWRIPQTGAGTYVYQCQSHAAMYGTINVKNIATI